MLLLNDTFSWPPVRGGKGGEIKSLNKEIKPPPGLGLEIGLDWSSKCAVVPDLELGSNWVFVGYFRFSTLGQIASDYSH